ncbi:MAG TPA: ribosome small subunit-dependent GTPase A [Candidatus Kapabacteria bacterium]|nr:ribosome small subunit-dependent GTPase A [Candidatus Kapabacteria bacterium]
MSKKISDFESAQKREKLKISTKSKLVRNVTSKNTFLLRGRVISIIGKSVIVELEDNQQTIYTCVVSGRINSPHKKSTLICVGDYVRFMEDEANDSQLSGRIVEVEERLKKFSRRTPGKSYGEHVIASNIDYVIFFFSVFDPEYNKRLIDRMLIGAEIGLVKPILCINKIDLAEGTKEIKVDLKAYTDLGIPIFLISVEGKKGIKKLTDYILNSTTLVFGPSGVGKSSFINLLLKDEVQKVNEISEKTGKGLHTTSFVKLLHYKQNTIIIDSPGIREFGLWDMDRQNLSFHFHDFDKFYLDCKFLPCTHIHEPSCAVKQAVEQGLVDYDRYQSYINIFDTIDDDIDFV